MSARLLDLVWSLCFFPLSVAALLLPLTYRKLTVARFRFCIFVGARLLLCGGARDKLRHWRSDQSDCKRGGKYELMQEFTSLYFQGAGRCRPAIGRSPQPETSR